MADGDFAPHTNVRMGNSGVGTVEYGGGAQAQLAIFYVKAAHNPAKSAEAGCPIYEDRIFVRISPPGERLNIIDRPATVQDKRIWAKQWAEFEQNREQTPEGTPIDQLYPESPAVGAMMRANGVHTVQQLAGLSANAIENIGMGTQRYVNEAQAYLKSAGTGAASVQIRRELEASQRDVKVLQGTVEALKQEIGALRAGQASQMVTMSNQELQAIIAGAQTRPQMPPSGTVRGQVFDAATAQINAVSNRAQPAKKKREKL